MALKPYFVVQPFVRGTDGKIIPDPPVDAPGEAQARRWAYRMSYERAGVIAFYRIGDPSTGNFQDPVEIVRYGEVEAEGSAGLIW